MRLSELLDRSRKTMTYDMFCIIVDEENHLTMLEKGTDELNAALMSEIGDITPELMTGRKLYCNYAGLISSDLLRKYYPDDKTVLVITIPCINEETAHGYKYIDGVWRSQIPVARCHCDAHKGCLNPALIKKHGCLTKTGNGRCSFLQPYEGHSYWKMREAQKEKRKSRKERLSD